MPEHMLTPEVEIITDGSRRRRWTAAEKLRIVEETLDGSASIWVDEDLDGGGVLAALLCHAVYLRYLAEWLEP